MAREYLVAAGLTKDQAALYEILLESGNLPARIAARNAAVPRTLTYTVLQQLQELGLVEKRKEKGTISRFSAAHPFKLQELAAKRKEEAEKAAISLDASLSSLVSIFNIRNGKPGIRILPGLGGVAELYRDVLRERQPICLVRSPNDSSHPELAKLIEKQKKEQARLRITTRVITSKRHPSFQEKITEDKKFLITRRMIRNEEFKPPAQMMLYGSKVALTAYGGEIITTIIENTAIHATCSLLFEYIWLAARAEHEHVVSMHR